MRERIIPTTGFWMFLCNPRIWNADEWFARGETELYYKISSHHQNDMIAGQSGILRIGKDLRSRVMLDGRPKLDAGVYAIFRVLGPAEFRVDPDGSSYNGPQDAKPTWRAPVRLEANLFENPVLLTSLPNRKEFARMRRAPFTSSVAIERTAFDFVAMRSGHRELADGSVDASWTSDDERLPDTQNGIRVLESKFSGATPKNKYRVSKRIERGSIGRKIKFLRKGRCQVCEALGVAPISFRYRNGRPYSEAHHVIPVRLLLPGSLGGANIMVLCPNHHRQAHHGAFDVLRDGPHHWTLRIDGTSIEIEKPVF